jgi:FKBP-type peptidyl-prolyl cis-trans isomerase
MNFIRYRQRQMMVVQYFLVAVILAVCGPTFAAVFQPVPTDAATYYKRGHAYFQKHEYKKAIIEFTRTIQLAPDLALAYGYRGSTYLQLNDYDKAITDLTKSIQLDPNTASSYSNRSLAYRAIGKYNDAIVDCNRAIRIKPNFLEAYNNRGLAYRLLGEYDKAIADYNEAIRINPDYVRVYYNRGTVYDSKGEFDKAIADYTKSIQLDATFAQAYQHRAFTYLKSNEFKNAITDYTKAIQLSPNSVGYLQRGLAYKQLDNIDKADADFAKAKELGVDTRFLTLNRLEAGVKTTRSGLQYRVVKSGSGKTPKESSQVTVHYEGSFVTEKIFDSSFKRNKPATFPVNGVIRGWTEALQLMKEGDEWILFIPAKLAYGEKGVGEVIYPGATLIFRVQLLKVED